MGITSAAYLLEAPGAFRARRLGLRYSQSQLSRVLGVSVATVQAWEHGRRAIRPSVWAHLALVEERARQYRDRPAPGPRPSIGTSY